MNVLRRSNLGRQSLASSGGECPVVVDLNTPSCGGRHRLCQSQRRQPSFEAETGCAQSRHTQLRPSSRRLASARRHGRHSNRAEVALTLSIELGLRAIELAALTFGDVYGPEGGVRPAISIKPAYMATVEVSIVDIESTKLRGLLADYREIEFGGRGAADCIPLFRSQRDGALTAASMARFVTGLYHRAGISNGSSRSGRRTLLDRHNHIG
jgi:integrase